MLTNLPNQSNWRFDDIAKLEPTRASLLELVGPPDALISAILDALDESIASNDIRYGREHASTRYDDCRVVVQFGVDVRVFDWFFNGRTGYRAHFRAGYQIGLRFNHEIIEAVRLRLNAALNDIVSGRELNDCFEDCGATRISKNFLMESLVGHLSKVWFCTKRIGVDGPAQDLPVGVTGPRLIVGNMSWAAPYRESDSAWLDFKGAFIGPNGPYQPKPPVMRAQKLKSTGEA